MLPKHPSSFMNTRDSQGKPYLPFDEILYNISLGRMLGAFALQLAQTNSFECLDICIFSNTKIKRCLGE